MNSAESSVRRTHREPALLPGLTRSLRRGLDIPRVNTTTEAATLTPLTAHTTSDVGHSQTATRTVPSPTPKCRTVPIRGCHHSRICCNLARTFRSGERLHPEWRTAVHTDILANTICTSILQVRVVFIKLTNRLMASKTASYLASETFRTNHCLCDPFRSFPRTKCSLPFGTFHFLRADARWLPTQNYAV